MSIMRTEVVCNFSDDCYFTEISRHCRTLPDYSINWMKICKFVRLNGKDTKN